MYQTSEKINDTISSLASEVCFCQAGSETMEKFWISVWS